MKYRTVKVPEHVFEALRATQRRLQQLGCNQLPAAITAPKACPLCGCGWASNDLVTGPERVVLDGEYHCGPECDFVYRRSRGDGRPGAPVALGDVIAIGLNALGLAARRQRGK